MSSGFPVIERAAPGCLVSLVPCSYPFCKSPHGGYVKPDCSRPSRLTITVNGVRRVYCAVCSKRTRERLARGVDPDAAIEPKHRRRLGPKVGRDDDDDDTGPEPTKAEVEELFAIDHWFLAGFRVNCTLASLPPLILDELSGAAFSGRLVDAFDTRDIVTIYGDIKMYSEIR